MIRYVVRWALSSGILAVDGEYTKDGRYFTNHGKGHIFVSAKEAFERLDDAKKDARKRAQKKAQLLRAQADKFSDPKWEPKVRA